LLLLSNRQPLEFELPVGVQVSGHSWRRNLARTLMIGRRFVRCRANLPRNPKFLRLWSALVVSGCCVSANEMAATWAMNSLGTPVLWLSLMSSAAHLTVLSVQVACWRVGRACRSPPTASHFQCLAGYQRGPAGLLRVDPRNHPCARLSAGHRFCVSRRWRLPHGRDEIRLRGS
jgi:hypothetical protein